jgi:predicted Zn-dependent protease
MRIALVLALLVAGAVLAMLGTADPGVNLSAVRSLWADTLRDADQIGMRLTRISAADEMKIGADLARSLSPYKEDADVTHVAQPLLRYTRRRGMLYRFHVIESTEINAFALPGGQIFVTASLLDFVESEAELAAVLGHEISHVDLRHCIERYQYQYKLKKAGFPDELGWLTEAAHRLAAMGFSQDQELEADAQGQRLAIEAGYDPDAAVALFSRMAAQFDERTSPRATTPAGELKQAVGEAIGSYFRTHPPSEQRMRELQRIAASHR